MDKFEINICGEWCNGKLESLIIVDQNINLLCRLDCGENLEQLLISVSDSVKNELREKIENLLQENKGGSDD